jgi:hypothetical protein
LSKRGLTTGVGSGVTIIDGAGLGSGVIGVGEGAGVEMREG